MERIDHGVQATHDADLMVRLAQERIPLTTCPLSNIKLCVFPDLTQHTLPQLLDAGLCATINSDDPAYFGGYIYENFLQTFRVLDLGPSHAYQLAKNSFEASFFDDLTKQKWITQLDECFLRFGARIVHEEEKI